MRIIVACGGTGGHLFPGIAAGDALRRRGHDVELYLGGRDVEHLGAREWDGPVVRVHAEGFSHGLSLKSLRTASRLWQASRTCYTRLKASPPAVVLAMGGYASVGPVLAARKLRIPIVLHEANAVPGKAVTFLSRFARVVALTFEETAAFLPGCRTVHTGLPIRPALSAAPIPPPANPQDSARCTPPFTLLAMGGSQGALRLNDTVTRALQKLQERGRPLHVIHLAGPTHETQVRAYYQAAGVSAQVFGFLDAMSWAYHQADWAIARAGAASCMELAHAGLPALLVPLPSAARDHQTANARAMVKLGVADLKAQHELTPEWLADYLDRVRMDPARAETRRTAMTRLRMEKAAERLADVTEAHAE